MKYMHIYGGCEKYNRKQNKDTFKLIIKDADIVLFFVLLLYF